MTTTIKLSSTLPATPKPVSANVSKAKQFAEMIAGLFKKAEKPPVAVPSNQQRLPSYSKNEAEFRLDLSRRGLIWAIPGKGLNEAIGIAKETVERSFEAAKYDIVVQTDVAMINRIIAARQKAPYDEVDF